MINFNSPLWLKFAPKKRFAPSKRDIVLLLSEKSKTKFRVVERRIFFSGITTRVDSTREYTFEDYAPAYGYIEMRLKNFYKNGRKEFDAEKRGNEVADLSFTTIYIYE